MKIINLSEYKRKKSGEIEMSSALAIDNRNSIDYIVEGDNKISIEDVSNYFLSISPMSNKKLQKICYYSYSWYLNMYKKELFKNNFEAWRHGPVNPTLYKKYKSYGYRDIIEYDNVEIPYSIKQFLDKIYECYGKLTAGDIEQLSHIEDPWKKTRIGLFDFEPSNKVIRKELIENYYINKYGNILNKDINFEKIINRSWDK